LQGAQPFANTLPVSLFSGPPVGGVVFANCYIRLIVLADRLIVDGSIPLHKEYPLV